MGVHIPIIRRLLFHPLRVAAIDDQRRWRGLDLLVGALHVAQRIEKESQARHIGVMLPSAGAFPMAALAVWWLGRTLVPLNFLLKSEELDYVIRDSESALILTSRKLLEHMDREPRGARLLCLEDLSFKGMPEPRWPARPDDDELATLLYTSGTTGLPKGVMLTHGNLRTNVQQCLDWVPFNETDTLVGVLPQFHSFGLTVLTLLPLTAGCRIVYAARFVPQKIVKLMRDHRPTCFVALPSMYNALLSVKKASPDDFKTLRYTVSGGEPLPDAVFERFLERFEIRIHEGYGLTETSPVTNWLRPWEFRRHSVGKPVPRCVERIVDPETERVLGPDDDGEIRIAGPNVFHGYFKMQEETRSSFDRDGFFKTGDMGRMDADGMLYITGRIKEMLIVGGENVFPREIEEVLNKHPSVSASGVIGVEDPMRGEVPAAYVELNEDAEFDEGELRQWCRDRIANYKVPRWIRRLDELPKGPTGKVLRRDLAERAKTEGEEATLEPRGGA